MRHILLALCLMSLLSAPAFAAFQGPGAKVPATKPSVATVADALKAPEDIVCVFEGNIIEKLPKGDNKYSFKDPTGVIVVEIDEDVFGDNTVTPATKVRIKGKVDKKKKRDNTVDVKRLEVIQ